MTPCQIVELPSGPLHIVLDGFPNRPPILLLHGLPCSLDWFGPLTEILCSSYRIIRVDLPGQGCTGGKDRLRNAEQTRSLIELLDRLHIDKPVVVGHSFGTDSAVDLAAAGRARSVVLIGAPDNRRATVPPGLGLIARRPLVFAAQLLGPSSVIRAATRHLSFGPRFRWADLPGFAEIVVRDFVFMAPAAARVALVDRRHDLAADPLDDRIRRLRVPVLAIHGRHDRLNECATSIARYSAAGARTEIVEDTGHCPHVERPAEVAALIREFVTPPRQQWRSYH